MALLSLWSHGMDVVSISFNVVVVVVLLFVVVVVVVVVVVKMRIASVN